MGIVYLLILLICSILLLYIPKNEVTANDTVIIPNEAIRLRILANSDSEEDQAVKRHVRDVLNEEITKWVEDLTSVEEARKLIRSRISELQTLAEKVLIEDNVQQTVQTEFGKIAFPTKLYGEYLYPAGEYEGVLITIGEGKGANWWCVLFPPLCFLDFSNGVAVSEGVDEGEKAKSKNEDSANQQMKAEESIRESDKEEEQNPLYIEEEEEPIKVKFFIFEVIHKIFH